MKVKSDHRSKLSNLSNWKEEAWKISGLQRDWNPWPLRYRCDARPTELWSHIMGAKSILLSSYLPMQWNDVKCIWNSYCTIYNMNFLYMSYIIRIISYNIQSFHIIVQYTIRMLYNIQYEFHLYFMYISHHFTAIYNMNVVQYSMNFIYISHHFSAREDMNSTNWPCSQCVASQLSWSSIAPVSRRSRVRIPLKP